MKASQLFHDKSRTPDGFIVEMTIWQLPGSDPDRPHGLKYSLFFGRSGERLVGYDNERGKGDHKHVLGREQAYRFKSVEQLMEDFLNDVAAVRRALADSKE
jgi:hypothetical protein